MCGHCCSVGIYRWTQVYYDWNCTFNVRFVLEAHILYMASANNFDLIIMWFLAMVTTGHEGKQQHKDKISSFFTLLGPNYLSPTQQGNGGTWPYGN